VTVPHPPSAFWSVGASSRVERLSSRRLGDNKNPRKRKVSTRSHAPEASDHAEVYADVNL